MKPIYVVVSEVGVIMAAFSEKEPAKLCKKHYEKRVPDCTFSIELEFLDLFTNEDYE